jgi:hypothetical protein
VGASSPKGERGGKALDEPGPTLKGYHDENPKLFFGVASKHCNYPVLMASPVSTLHWQEPPFIKVCSRIAQILLISSIDGPFWSGHYNAFKSFFLLWIWTVIIRPDVKT